MNVLRVMFGTRSMKLSLLFLIITNIIIALSTFFMGNLGSLIQSGGDLTFYISCAMITIFASSIPKRYAERSIENTKYDALKIYTKKFSKNHYCRPTLNDEKKYRSEKESLLTGESEKIIIDTVDLVKESVSTGLHTTFNLLALSYIVHPSLLLSYLGSFLTIVYIKRLTYFQDSSEALSKQNQENRNTLQQILLSGWENTTIGNRHNYELWRTEFDGRLKKTKHSSVALIWLKESLTFRNYLIASIPVIINILYLFNNPTVVPALVATLFRQAQLIDRLQLISKLNVNWQTILTKLNKLVQAISVQDQMEIEYNLSPLIKWREILITQNGTKVRCETITELYNLVKNSDPMRLTLQGDNGKGKTLILKLLKQRLGDSAFYFPTNSSLLFHSTYNVQVSSGQNVKANLEEGFTYISQRLNDIKIILLDEWNANLDLNNTQIISKRISDLARRFVVIETRHKFESKYEGLDIAALSQDHRSTYSEGCFLSAAALSRSTPIQNLPINPPPRFS